MSEAVEGPTTGERLNKAYDILMDVTCLAHTIERACIGATDWDGQRLRNVLESIATSVELLGKMVGDAAEEVETCEEYNNTSFDYLQREREAASCNT